MAVGSIVGPPSGKSGNQETYLASFIEHAHRLILMGYKRFDVASHQKSDEPDISGELIQMMNEAIEDENAEDWVPHFFVPDDQPVNAPHRKGKHRRRVDIMIVRSQRGRRPKLQFEAKRLYDNGPAHRYLGEEGLGRFLSGKYAREHKEAGMLGYVQTDDEQTWADCIQALLEKKPQKYALRKDGAWHKHAVIDDLEHTYLTRHDRTNPLKPIAIYHILLRFF
jgi:hypothetical protein